MTIISGGQTGADQGALIGAKKCGFQTGGTAPKGWVTELGPMKDFLKSFGLVEGPVDPKIYPKRTMLNVDNSDCTIIILWGKSVGSLFTLGYAQTGIWKYGDIRNVNYKNFNKPALIIPGTNPQMEAYRIAAFIDHIEPNVINFAGHRESSKPGISVFTQNLINMMLF